MPGHQVLCEGLRMREKETPSWPHCPSCSDKLVSSSPSEPLNAGCTLTGVLKREPAGAPSAHSLHTCKMRGLTWVPWKASSSSEVHASRVQHPCRCWSHCDLPATTRPSSSGVLLAFPVESLPCIPASSPISLASLSLLPAH